MRLRLSATQILWIPETEVADGRIMAGRQAQVAEALLMLRFSVNQASGLLFEMLS